MSIYVGKTSGASLYQGMAIQFFWVLAAYGLARLMWARGGLNIRRWEDKQWTIRQRKHQLRLGPLRCSDDTRAFTPHLEKLGRARDGLQRKFSPLDRG